MNKNSSASLDDYTVFRLLCELERGAVSSQRDLAARLDCALGLVNSYLKGCTESGWIRVKETPSVRGRYHITARGAAEKRRLSILHARYIDEMIAVVTEEYRKIAARLHDEGIDRVAFCGIDSISIIPIHIIQSAGISVTVAMDTQGIGASFMGRDVVSIAHAMLAGVYKVVITSINRSTLLYTALLDTGAEPESIFIPPLFLEPKN